MVASAVGAGNFEPYHHTRRIDPPFTLPPSPQPLPPAPLPYVCACLILPDFSLLPPPSPSLSSELRFAKGRYPIILHLLVSYRSKAPALAFGLTLSCFSCIPSPYLFHNLSCFKSIILCARLPLLCRVSCSAVTRSVLSAFLLVLSSFAPSVLSRWYPFRVTLTCLDLPCLKSLSLPKH